MSIIINADDFGINSEVNQAICECFSKKLIDRTTLMVNMPFADEAARLAKEQQFFDHVGLHLNLTSGKPLTEKIAQNQLFCDHAGYFHAGFYKSTMKRLYMSPADVQMIRDELEAQIKKYLEYGFTCRHLDSHHHVHTNLPILKALIPLIKQNQIRTVRLGRNLFHKERFFNVIYKKFYNGKLQRMQVCASQYFGSYADYIRYMSDPSIDQAAFEVKYQTEIMVHPMYDKNGILTDADLTMDQNWISVFETR